MSQRMALYMQDMHPIQYEIEMVKYAEEKGFSEIWQADTRLARDCVVMMSAFLAETKRMRFGSGVLPLPSPTAGICTSGVIFSMDAWALRPLDRSMIPIAPRVGPLCPVIVQMILLVPGICLGSINVPGDSAPLPKYIDRFVPLGLIVQRL